VHGDKGIGGDGHNFTLFTNLVSKSEIYGMEGVTNKAPSDLLA
jgi:hypothetical protein